MNFFFFLSTFPTPPVVDCTKWGQCAVGKLGRGQSWTALFTANLQPWGVHLE